ncbi:hypothetical protein FQN60_008793, partial [Etheostoma spectabile]
MSALYGFILRNPFPSFHDDSSFCKCLLSFCQQPLFRSLHSNTFANLISCQNDTKVDEQNLEARGGEVTQQIWQLPQHQPLACLSSCHGDQRAPAAGIRPPVFRTYSSRGEEAAWDGRSCSRMSPPHINKQNISNE